MNDSCSLRRVRGILTHVGLIAGSAVLLLDLVLGRLGGEVRKVRAGGDAVRREDEKAKWKVSDRAGIVGSRAILEGKQEEEVPHGREAWAVSDGGRLESPYLEGSLSPGVLLELYRFLDEVPIGSLEKGVEILKANFSGDDEVAKLMFPALGRRLLEEFPGEGLALLKEVECQSGPGVYLLDELMDSAVGSDLTGVIDYIDDLELGEYRRRVMEGLLERWGKIDSGAAMDYASGIGDQKERSRMIAAIAAGIVESGLEQVDDGVRAEFGDEIQRALARKAGGENLDSYLATVAGISGPEKSALDLEIARRWAAMRPEYMADYVLGCNDHEFEYIASRELACRWAMSSPAAAGKWFLSRIEIKGIEDQDVFLGSEVGYSCFYSGFRVGMDFVGELPEGRFRDQVIDNIVSNGAVQGVERDELMGLSSGGVGD